MQRLGRIAWISGGVSLGLGALLALRSAPEDPTAWLLVGGAVLLGVGAIVSRRPAPVVALHSRTFDGLEEGVLLIDTAGRVVLASQAARRMLGIGTGADAPVRDDWLGHCFLADGVTPYPRDALPLTRALAGGTVEPTDLCIRSDVPRWIRVSGAPLRDESGTVTGAVAVLRDVTAARDARQALDRASAVQRRLYPRKAPRIPGFDLAGAVQSVEATCGDYFDFQRLADGRLVIAIGDVCGHGLGPAMVMTEVRAYLRSFFETGDELDQVVRSVNRVLAADLEPGLLVTLLVALVDPATRTLEYVNAGHVPGLVLGANGAVRHKLTRTGHALALEPDATYDVGEVALESGDLVLLVTDGVIELRDPAGDEAWDQDVVRIAREHAARPAAEIIERIHEHVSARTRPEEADDETTVVLKVGPRRSTEAARRPSASN